MHLVRNSVKYVPDKDMKSFCAQIKKVYGAESLKAAQAEFVRFKEARGSKHPGSVAVWERNFPHVEQLFDYGSAVRKVIYTTNAVESVNSNFRKVTKKGAFPNGDAVKRCCTCVSRSCVRNGRAATNGIGRCFETLACDQRIAERVAKYERY